MIFEYFTDPLLRGPTIASMLMCLSASLIGVIVFLRKQSLLGEALSHATYPGVCLGVLLVGDHLVLLSAAVAAFLGLLLIYFLEKKINVPSDAALTFVLATFFGFGVTIASRLQFSHTAQYRKAQLYLYGQAATMTDVHIYLYLVLALFSITLVLFFYKEILVTTLDPEFAITIGVKNKMIDLLVIFMTVLAIVVGIRSVGVVLISAMLIAPAVAARQLTNHLHYLFILAAFFGVISGFLGNYFSFELGKSALILPTGPTIVLVVVSFALLALLFSKERGLIPRLIRAYRFKKRCLEENLLKTLWTYQEMDWQPGMKSALKSLRRQGWIEKEEICLTEDGAKRAKHLVRLHRLWELYLVEYLGASKERVHRSAEEIEHILTPEIEKELTKFLGSPLIDPHQQPIPPAEIL